MSSGTPALCGEFAEPEPFRFPTIFLYRLSSMSFIIALFENVQKLCPAPVDLGCQVFSVIQSIVVLHSKVTFAIITDSIMR